MPWDGSRFDEPSHWRTVSEQLPSTRFTGVSVCVEVDEAERSITVEPGESGAISVRD
jgi:hypothetical protein